MIRKTNIVTTLRQLRYFGTLAETLHFGRAAERCHITQPAMSLQIAELEKSLRVALIERRSRGITLTQEGEEIARRIRAILTDVKDLEDYAHHRSKMLVGQLKLGVIPTIGPYVLPSVLPALKQEFPHLELAVRETHTEHLVRELHETKIDVALLALPVDSPGLEELALFNDAFHLAVPADHPLANQNTVSHDALQEERILLLEEGHCLRDQAVAFCQTARAGGFDELAASSLSTIAQMVANGYGVTLLPDMATAVEMRDEDDMHILRFHEPAPYRIIGLVWRRTSPRKEEFAELGRAITRTLTGAAA